MHPPQPDPPEALLKADESVRILETRLDARQRIRKHHITNANKSLRQAFHWPLEQRRSFVRFMAGKGYHVVLCDTEADVRIAAECQPEDAVVSCDSDLLFYSTIPVLWRPLGSYRSRRYVPYEKTAVLEALGLSAIQLTALAILSDNDYVPNIPHLAFETNLKIIKGLPAGNEGEVGIVQQYLAHPQVKRQTDKEITQWTEHSYADAINVFVRLQQTVRSSVPADGDANSVEDAYASLSKRMSQFMVAFGVFKKEQYKSRRDKRAAHGEESRRDTVPERTNPFVAVDHPNPARAHQYRRRYTPKVRYEPTEERPPPDISLQYVLKPWKEGTEKPIQPHPAKKPTPVRPVIDGADPFERKKVMSELGFEHPIVTLNPGRMSKNIRTAIKEEIQTAATSIEFDEDRITKSVIECIRGAVKVAWETKIYSQQLIGLFLEDVFYPRSSPDDPRPLLPVTTLGPEDQAILDSLCPRLGQETDENSGSIEDGTDDGSNAPFIRGVLMYLYSGNISNKGEVAAAIKAFVRRLQDFGHLEKDALTNGQLSRTIKEYTPTFLIETMITKGKLSSNHSVDLTARRPAIQIFVDANTILGHPWCLAPLSSEEHGFMTFTELELAAFFHKRADLLPFLQHLVGYSDQSRPMAQTYLTNCWLPLRPPGLFIKRLIAPVDPKTTTGERLKGRARKDAGIAAAVKVVERSEIRSHINTLRDRESDPQSYEEKGYFLRGSIRTDGYQLQLLAFKLRELNSVKYKRYDPSLLPDRLLTTTAGTSDYLTEVRNVFKTMDDVERLLGCSSDEHDKVSYLGIDLGQAFVVGAYAHLPPDKNPRIHKGRRKKKRRRGSRGRRKRGSGKGKRRTSRAGRRRFINLVAKQKAVAQPSLHHRSWMEKQKGVDLKPFPRHSTSSAQSITAPRINQPSTSSAETTLSETLCINTIESSLPPLRGPNASIAGHCRVRAANRAHLDKFYNGHQFKFKRYKNMAKSARAQEFHRLADSLLRMVGGTIGEKKAVENKVVIGIGMGDFKSTSRMTSLHSSFQAFFVQKARALGYLVVGVEEYYTSKKCPTCNEFVAQTKSIRRLYCGTCRKSMHRDVMGGHNMANILRSHVEKQERPLYLHPVDKDGHFPWLERGGGPTRDDPRASGSRKRRHDDQQVNQEAQDTRTKTTTGKKVARSTTARTVKASTMDVDEGPTV
ncbi:hypothetical protein DFQ27_006905 [Actinomortierella ambigua]|uniref:Cas12f1-like TNB domain-containing protein n=1 Tax=Actinomortierella ambigua TaxID=1343610 RepID=A0A9P6U0E4_9FUNG|nr:hypothetical protein DFQ27_006905 [Actinomortierella ambigua]